MHSRGAAFTVSEKSSYINMELSVPSTLDFKLGTGEFLLSCQPRVTVTSCFVFKVIRDLELIDHLCINPIRRIGLIHSDLSIRFSSCGCAS